MEREVKHTEKAPRQRQARAGGDRKLPRSIWVREGAERKIVHTRLKWSNLNVVLDRGSRKRSLVSSSLEDLPTSAILLMIDWNF